MVQNIVPAKAISLVKSRTPILLEKGVQVVIGFVILIVAHFVAGIVRSLIVKHANLEIKELTLHKKDQGTYSAQEKKKQARSTSLIMVTLANIVYYFIMIFALLIVLRVIGIEATSIVAVLGATGFAIGLAVQGTLSDISSGIVLAILQLYAVGDVIEVNGVQGEVKDFTLLYTVIEDVSTMTRMTIPNRKIQDSIVTNHTKHNTRYVNIMFLVSNRNTDFEKIRNVVRDALKKHPGVLQSFEPSVGVQSLDSAGTLMRARVMINSEDYPSIQVPLRTTIREALAANKVEMIDALPQ
jgi:small conductance mechanosensitive channel